MRSAKKNALHPRDPSSPRRRLPQTSSRALMRLHEAPARLSIVYPTLGNLFYHQLATRLFEAASGLDVEARLLGSSVLGSVDPSWMKSVPAFVVSPNECLLSGEDVTRVLGDAPFRAAVLADSVGTQWYRNTFTLDIDFDLVVDVGYLDQDLIRPYRAVPYRLLCNAPLPREADSIRKAKPGSRPLTWALVGHVTTDRLQLAEQLLIRFGSEGFLFLPGLRPVRPSEGMLSPAALDRVLRSTNLYVWCSHHAFPYYESFRFLDAVTAGAVPCKIDIGSLDLGQFPNVFDSVESLAAHLAEQTEEGLFEASRQFALSNGLLTDRLAELLGDCLAFAR